MYTWNLPGKSCNFMAYLDINLYADNKEVILKQSLQLIIHYHGKVSVPSKHLEWPWGILILVSNKQ